MSGHDVNLHKLCHDGKLQKIEEFVYTLEPELLQDRLNNRRGIFGYTPLHEAVSGNQHKVIPFLVEQGANVNARANMGRTPLHLAISAGHIDCVKALLESKADISITDYNGKTPKQTAELSSKSNIVRLLRSEEIIKEVTSNGDNLTELLHVSVEDLEPLCLERALKAAVNVGNHFNIGKLVVKGATNIQEALGDSKRLKKHEVRAMLLLIIAAQTNDRDLVLKLFGAPTQKSMQHPLANDDNFIDVQKAIISGCVSTAVPIEIARCHQSLIVCEELLLRTNVNQEEGSVYWNDLHLLVLDLSWMYKIHWVKRLRLARNAFISIPNEIGEYLKQVVKLDLQHNELVTVPHCLFELPSLNELNLSNNKLIEIPDVREWSPGLTVLDLSFNELSALPVDIIAPSISLLSISYNHFRTVPLCVCSFVSLRHLNISYNPRICSLPVEMGRLQNLIKLVIDGLTNLSDPPRNMQRDARDCIRYLNRKLRLACKFYRMKLMVLGNQNRGKTTLVARLQGLNVGINQSTVGVDISEWHYAGGLGGRKYHFSIWDFGGYEEYYATHQCFLTEQSMYLLVWNVKHGERGIQELKPWLDNIALRAPRSCVLIVGTHLDCVEEGDRPEVDRLLGMVADLAQTYQNRLVIPEVLAVGLMNHLENIVTLREAIYNQATEYKGKKSLPIMGQEIPASYIQLNKELEKVQEEVRKGTRDPVMNVAQFKDLVHNLNLLDICSDEELRTVTLFLNDIGTIVHYDDRSYGINELYFIDPRWLCKMMSAIVTRNPFVKNGILQSKNVPFLFSDLRFQWQYFERYLCLLDRFEIALPLNNRQILIPSMLPDERPDEADITDEKSTPLYIRFINFQSPSLPGFWSRLISRIMYTIPQVYMALDALTDHSTETEFEEDMLPWAPPTTGTTDKTSAQTPALSPSQNQFLLPNITCFLIGDDNEKSTPLYIRFINFQSPSPSGFWSRLISRIMHMIPQVYRALDALADHNTETNFEEDTLTGVPTGSMTDETSVQMISHPILSPPQNQFLLPNITRFIIGDDDEEPLEPSDFTLLYWKEGIVYKGPELSFAVESLRKAKVSTRSNREGIVIIASPNSKGRKLICQMVDIVLNLIHEWYPGLEENNVNSGVEQRVPCYECRKLGREKPFEFKIDQYMSIITSNRPQIECGYEREPSKNHKVSLVDIMPDLLLQDLDADFLLKPEEIKFQEDKDSLLGEGGFGKVYRGKCRGKSVAIKKYRTRTEEAFNELRSEAKVLQKSHHPCIICLVGVSVHPLVALILEEAPMGSLERHLIKKATTIPRLVMFRIAAQVAAALRFLHQHGIIFRDLKAANVLLWSLNENSLCHSKITDFDIATHLAPVGIMGLQGTKGFIAPEVLYIGQKRAIYNHKADIFSFGMLLYQMIARRHPFHNVQPVRVDSKVVLGERPSTVDIPLAEAGYFFLTRLMEKCWKDKPEDRPETSDLIRDLSRIMFQSIMGLLPMKSRFSLKRGCAVTPHDYMKANVTGHTDSELWICCDGPEGMELNIFNTNSMAQQSRNFIKENQVQCMYVCGDHVWVCSRAGIEYGVIDIFSTITHELVHNICMRKNTVSCITCSDTVVYLGTLEGYCFAFDMDIKAIQNNCQPKYHYISEHAIEGIIVTEKHVWVSHTHFLSFLNLETLTLEHSSKRDESMDAFVGHLALSSQDSSIAWSAHLGGTMLSAWDTENEEHLYDIDVREVLLKQVGVGDKSENDAIMTCMTLALDVVWVGMATGHILLFHKQEMITFFHPYTQYLRFLITVPCEGPCQKEKCMVVSGAKGFQSPFNSCQLEDFPQTKENKSQSVDNSGVLILWEAYSGATLQQMKIIEEESPGYLDNHKTVARMIKNLQFNDDTNIIKDLTTNEGTETPASPDDTLNPFEASHTNNSPDPESSMTFSLSFADHQTPPDTIRGTSLEESSPEPIENPTMTKTCNEGRSFLPKIEAKQMQEMPENNVEEQTVVRPRGQGYAVMSEIFDIDIQGTYPGQLLRISCPKPVTLQNLMAKVRTEGNFQEFNLAYRQGKSEEVICLNSQDKFDQYMEMEKRVNLLLYVASAPSEVGE